MYNCRVRTGTLISASILAFVVSVFSNIQTFAAMPSEKDKVAQEIKELRNRWIEAEETKNIPFLQDLLADDCVIGNSQGQVLDKSRFLERIRNPNRTLKLLNSRDIQVRLYGNVAILTEAITVDGRESGRPFGGDFRFIRVFVERRGKWRVVLGAGNADNHDGRRKIRRSVRMFAHAHVRFNLRRCFSTSCFVLRESIY